MKKVSKSLFLLVLFFIINISCTYAEAGIKQYKSTYHGKSTSIGMNRISNQKESDVIAENDGNKSTKPPQPSQSYMHSDTSQSKARPSKNKLVKGVREKFLVNPNNNQQVNTNDIPTENWYEEYSSDESYSNPYEM